MIQFTSNSITLNVGAPQGCILSPLLYSLYTHDCVSSHSSTSIVKFADDTVVLGLISNNDETAYLGEVERLTSWCQDNCLSLNVSKTKELIVDFRSPFHTEIPENTRVMCCGICSRIVRFAAFTLPVIFRNLCVHSHTTRKDPVKTHDLSCDVYNVRSPFH